jgi:uncharacterized protein YjbI with pentapeptide repeats
MTTKAASPHVILEKPVSILNKPLKADFTGLFKALAKAAKDGFTQKWADLAPDLTEAATALGLKTEPGALAWLLVRQSLLRAFHTMLGQIAHCLKSQEANASISEQLDEALEKLTVVVDRDFFAHPGNLPLLKDVAGLLRQWLLAYGLNEAQAESVCRRLPANFVYALSQEWRANALHYAPLLKAADTPFLGAGEREQAWEFYNAFLQQQVEESLFQEPFSLTQVYVPLRAYYEQRKRGAEDELTGHRAADGCGDNTKTVVMLENHLEGWLSKSDRNDALRVLSGGPGSGKSCFAKMLAARQAAQGRRVIYMPLHLIDAKAELASEVGRVLQAGGFFSHNPLSAEDGDERVLLILDGLDELAMLGKIAENIAQAFVRAVSQHVDRRNQEKLYLQVLITGRTMVIEANSLEFRRDGQSLHLLSYVEGNSDQPGSQANWRDPEKLLKADQRHDWWKKYGLATGHNYDGLPKELARKDLVEVTAQPLLCLLVALSYERKRVDFSKEVNLNVVYDDLLNAIYDRPWGNQQNFAVRGMKPEHFCRVLEEIGVSAWHGNGRSTTVGEIRTHCERANLARMLDVFKEGAEAGVTRLLAAFYFRQSGVRNEEQAFEFTHKSFGEYLAARRIVGALARLSEEFNLHEREFDRGWDENAALLHWAQVCGPAELEPNIIRFLRQQVALAETHKAGEWQQALCTLIPFMLRKGLPMQMEKLTYGEASRQARNAEEAMLVALSACAERTQELSNVDWPEPTSAGTWLGRLQAQRTSDVPCAALQALCFLNLKDSCLHCCDLYGADLHGSCLQGIVAAVLIAGEANLKGVNLGGADLRNAAVWGANLEGANLESADLDSADLESANLESANLVLVKLQGANLRGANLRGANLRGADLRNANLEDATLEGASLEDAKLEGANVKGTVIAQRHPTPPPISGL